MSHIEIETSSDSVEQVKEAMGNSAEIEDTTTETENTEKETPAEEKHKEGDENQPEVETTEEEQPAEEKEEKPKEETEKGKAKPTKDAPNLVPRSRLNEEIRKRKAVEGELEKEKSKPRPKADVVEETVEAEPQNLSGEPEPKIEDFIGNEKYPDPYAAFTKSHGAWVRKETLAEVEQKKVQEAAAGEQRKLVENFNNNLKGTIARHPDYSDVVPDSEVQVSGFMERRIYKSSVGPDMLYYLASNPEKAAEICAMDLDDQAVEMVALEKQIQTAVAKAAPPKEEAEETPEEEADGKPKGKAIPKKELPRKTVTPPEPPNRIKPAGPGPKSLEELAGPPDRTGVDIDFNPEYEKAVKAGQRR